MFFWPATIFGNFFGMQKVVTNGQLQVPGEWDQPIMCFVTSKLEVSAECPVTRAAVIFNTA